MRLFKSKNKSMAVNCTACLIAAGLLLSPLSAPVSRAEERTGESGVAQTVHNGFTYSYQELKGYPGSVEIVGVTMPKGETVLTIPDTLDGKKVISLDLEYDSVSPRQDLADEGSSIKKLVLPGTVMPLKDTSGDESKLSVLGSSLYQLEDIEVQPGSSYLKGEGGILYSADGSSLICYPPKNKTEEYRMPSSVTSSFAYIKNNNLKRIVLSDNAKFKTVASIGNCDNLESVYLPDNITILYHGAFGHCPKLKTIRWSKNLKAIGEEAFQNCLSLTQVKLPGKVRFIGSHAFRWCHSLKKVTLPASVAVVGWGAFSPSKGKKAPEIKKASYLLSTKNKKLRKDYPNVGNGGQYDKYAAVLTATKNGKKNYYVSDKVFSLIPSAKKISLNAGKTKKISITPEIDDVARGGVKKGWKAKTDILTFKSSNTKVAKVTAAGKIKGVKKGNAVITVGMKTSDIKCRIKVKIK